jgi:hypothetical protein
LLVWIYEFGTRIFTDVTDQGRKYVIDLLIKCPSRTFCPAKDSFTRVDNKNNVQCPSLIRNIRENPCTKFIDPDQQKKGPHPKMRPFL